MKKRRILKFNFNRKNKLLISLIAVFVLFFTLSVTFGRYVYDMFQNYILETKGFYFNSSVMSSIGTKHSINNWDGVNAYQITIDVNNQKNEYVWTQTDITYDISVECSDNLRCVLSKTEGVIYKDVKVDSYTITIYPKGNFTNNQTAQVKTVVKSSFPFVKELSTVYNIGIETTKFSYKINDNAGDKYMVLELTNAFTYYKAEEAFGSYARGDNIPIEDYEKLSQADKDKCMSAVITLNFDPNLILLDMTDESYLNRIDGYHGLVSIDGHNYVNEFRFDMNASSTTKIIFYKKDTSQNYTYPSDNSIVNVSVYSVEDFA